MTNNMPERISAYLNAMGLGCFEFHPNIPLTTGYIRADVAAAQLAERDARIAELEAAMRDIARWRQEDQDDVEIAILQWRGCVAIARGALGVTDVTP